MQSPSRSDAATATVDGDGDGDHAALLQHAEAEAAAAEAKAAEARARAAELRRQAGLVDGTDADVDASDDDPEGESLVRVGRRPRRPTAPTIAGVVAIALSVALLAASGYVLWFHHQVDREHQRRAEFAAAASHAVVTLMSIDSASAQDDVERIVATSTGQFRDDFQSSAEEFVKTAQDSKATTKATVGAAAVESMSAGSAVVLVTAATTVSNTAGADQQPRNWRLSVTMLDDGTGIKLSKVEFVP